jgi:hypothetical protein
VLGAITRICLRDWNLGLSATTDSTIIMNPRSEFGLGSGGGRESNPPGSSRPHTGFEGMSDARTAFEPMTSVFVFGRRPRTCKDL